MAILKCICGNLMYPTDNEDYEFQMIRMNDILKISEKINEIKSGEFFDAILDDGYNVCFCEKCHRLWIQKLISGKHTYTPYRLESDCK